MINGSTELRFGTALNYVGGKIVDDGSNLLVDSIDPATGLVIGRYAAGSRELAEAAAETARAAFFDSQWAHDSRLRASVLLQFADRLEAAKDELAELLSYETGKLSVEAVGEVNAAVTEARFYAGLARIPQGRSSEIVPHTISILTREPSGVAAVIVPWNAPITLLVRSLAPALAAGCTVVVKAAPQSTLISGRVMALLTAIPGVPDGVVNIVNENGIEVGETLAASEHIDVITFTGSSRTGKRIMKTAAATLKRLSLELGGKSPGIVFPDADLDVAARELRRGALALSGQFCMCASRILVHDDVYEDMKGRLVAAFSGVRLGPGYVAASEMAPLIDRANQQRVLALIELAAQEGDLVLRGTAGGPELARGAFVSPTLVAIEDTASMIVREEHFGPLITLERFSSEAEAVAKAHATRYGLAASIYTRDLARSHRLSRNLRFGTIWLNCHRRQFPEAEVGGFGDSGLGRLHGVEALQDFLETKHTFLDYGADA